MYSRASDRLRTPLSPIYRRKASSFNNSRMKPASLSSSWRNTRRFVSMTIARRAVESDAPGLSVRLIPPLIVECRQQRCDLTRVRAGSGGETLHHPFPVGGGVVLTDFPLAGQSGDRELEPDDQR